MQSKVLSPRVGLTLLLAASALPCAAQTVQTANQHIRLNAYGMFSYVRPDYGYATRNLGATIGGNLDGFRVLPYTDIGLDVRYVTSSGDVSNQHVFSGGPRVSFNAFRLRPYADFLFGSGRADFKNSAYPYDTSRVTTYGGGLDLDVARYWALRADVQRQRWQFSKTQPYFYPLQVSVGVNYRIHLPSRTGPRY